MPQFRQKCRSAAEELLKLAGWPRVQAKHASFTLAQRRERAAHGFLAHPAVADAQLRCLEQRITYGTALAAAGHRRSGFIHSALLARLDGKNFPV